MKHFLVTVELTGPYRIHGYVMTNDQNDVMAIATNMMDYAEQQNFKPLGIILSTELSVDGVTDPVSVEFVRKIVCEVDPRVEQAIQTATDFHVTTWLMPKAHPSDGPLMKLH